MRNKVILEVAEPQKTLNATFTSITGPLSIGMFAWLECVMRE